MSKKANATGSRGSTYRGKLVSTDPDFAKKELQKHRRIGLEHVRQQSKDIAEDVRNKVQKEKTEQLSSLEKRGDRELRKWQNERLVALQQQYQECLKDIGLDHIQATIEEESDEAMETQKKGHDYVAQQRGELTIKGLQKQKEQKQISKSTSFMRKKHVHKVEKAKSTYVINLNTKKINSTFQKNKRKGVLGATSSPSRLCKGSASESEITELLQFYSSNSSSKSSTPKIALTERYTSQELQYVRGDYNRLSENTDDKKLTVQYVSSLSRPEYPFDTQKSARIKRKTIKSAFDEPVRNICDNVIRDGNTKKKTRYEGPIKSPNKKHSQPEHLNKKNISISEQPMHDLIKNADEQIHTQPRESSRTAPARKRVTSATSKQCYDHKNRYFKEYVRNNAVYENIDVRSCTDSETEFVERIYKRDSGAKLRGNKALKQLKVHHDYEKPMHQLPVLQKQERITSIPTRKTTYHMSENRPKQLEQKRQKVLDFDAKEKAIPNSLLKNIDSNLIREAVNKVAAMPTDADVLSQRRENLQNMLSSAPVDCHLYELFDGFENIDTLINVGETATRKSSISNQQQRARIRHRTDRASDSQNIKASNSSLSPCYRISKLPNNFANEIPSLQERERRGSRYHTNYAGSHSAKLCVCCGCAEQACEIAIKVTKEGEPEICLSPIKLIDVSKAVSIPESSLKKPNVKISKEKQKVTSKIGKPDKPKSGDEQKTKAVRVNNVGKPRKNTYFETSGLSWREQFIKNSSNSSTSCYGPPTSIRAQQQPMASNQKVKPDFGHLCCGTGDASNTLNSYLYQHIKRLLMMSLRSVEALGVSSASDVSTPSSSVVNVQPNLSSNEFMKHLNLHLSNIERYIRCSPDYSHIHYNSPASTIRFKSNAQIHSPRDARQMALDEYTVENYSGILMVYNKLVENCVKKIENLAAMIDKVQLNKLSMLQSRMSLSDKKQVTEYMGLPTKFKEQKSSEEHKACQSDAGQEELIRQLLEIDYSLAEQLKKMNAADVAEEKLDTINVELIQRYKNLLASRTKQGLQPTTLEMVSDNSTSELENIESVLIGMGLGWAVATLRKTQEPLTLTSSSNSSVDVGAKQKEINQTDSDSVSFKDTSKKEILAKLSTSSTTTEGTSTFSPFSNEFRNINQGSSVSQEKALLQTSTPTESSRLTDNRSRNATQPRIIITGEDSSMRQKEATMPTSTPIGSSKSTDDKSKNDIQLRAILTSKGVLMRKEKGTLKTSTPIQSSDSTDDKWRYDPQSRIIITGEGSPVGQEEANLQTSTPIRSGISTDDKSRNIYQPRITATGEGSSMRQEEATLRTSSPIQSSKLTDDKSRNIYQPRVAVTGEDSTMRQKEAISWAPTPIQSSNATYDRLGNDTQPRIIITGEGLQMRQEEATYWTSPPIQSSDSTDDRWRYDPQSRSIITGEGSSMRQEANLRASTPIESSNLTDYRWRNDTQPHIITTGEGSPKRQEEATLRTSTPTGSSKLTDDKSRNIYQPRIDVTGEGLTMRQEETTLRTFTPIQISDSTGDRWEYDPQFRILTTSEGSSMRQEEANLRTSTPIGSSKSTDDKSKNDTQPRVVLTGKGLLKRQKRATLKTSTPIQSSDTTDDPQSRIFITGEESSMRQEEGNLWTSTDDKSINETQPRVVLTGKGLLKRKNKATLKTSTPIQSSDSTDDRWRYDPQSRIIITDEGSSMRQEEAIYQPRVTVTGEDSTMRQDEATMLATSPLQNSNLPYERFRNATQPPVIIPSEGLPMSREEATLRTSTPIQNSISTYDRLRNDTQPRITTASEGLPMRQEEATLRTSTPIESSKSTDDKSRNIYQPRVTVTGEDSTIRQEEATLRTTTPMQSGNSTYDRLRNDTQPRITTASEGLPMRQEEATLRTFTPIESSKSTDDKSRNIYQPRVTVTGEDSTIRQEEATLRTTTPMQSGNSTYDRLRNGTQPRITIASEDLPMRPAEATLETSTPIGNIWTDNESNIYPQPPNMITGKSEVSPFYSLNEQLSSTSGSTSESTVSTSSINTEFQKILALQGLSMSQDKANLRTTTSIQSSESTDDESKDSFQLRIPITGESEVLPEEYLYAKVDGAPLYSLKKQSPIQSGSCSESTASTLSTVDLNILEDQGLLMNNEKTTDRKQKKKRPFRQYLLTGHGWAVSHRKTSLPTPTPIENSIATDDKSNNDTQPRTIITDKRVLKRFKKHLQ